ncbi:MAG: phosphoglycerate dehydrogenase [Bacteroidia bacterium]|nr:phosphoglycerate dehydrogenase [Bacteroidia bacterium]
MKVLIIDDVSSLLTDGLEKIGYQVTYLPNINRNEILEIIAPFEVLVVRTKTSIDKEILNAAPNLKIIARAGSGLDNIDLESANQRGIYCFNAGQANADAVGEHTLGMLLSLMRNLAKADLEVRNKIWDREGNRGYELNGKTVGIIGFGNTGKSFAKKLAGFEVKILVYDKYLENYSNQNAKEAKLEQIFEEADILSLHIPLTAETKNWINANFFTQFKKNIYLLNMCRGEVVNMPETIEYLNNNKIIGACFDVLENEKINTLSNQQQKDFDYLINNKNVVLSPHIAGWTFESYEKIAQSILLKLTDLK